MTRDGGKLTHKGDAEPLALILIDDAESHLGHARLNDNVCYALANQGTDTRTLQAYLGHRNISNTVRYTELAAGRFKNLWKD